MCARSADPRAGSTTPARGRHVLGSERRTGDGGRNKVGSWRSVMRHAAREKRFSRVQRPADPRGRSVVSQRNPTTERRRWYSLKSDFHGQPDLQTGLAEHQCAIAQYQSTGLRRTT